MISPTGALSGSMLSASLVAEKHTLLSGNLSSAPANSGSRPGGAVDDDSLITSAGKFLNSIDEFSAFISQVRRLRDLAGRCDFSAAAEIYELLDDDAAAKIAALWRVVKIQDSNSAARLLQEARTLFPDESNRVVALREMLKHRNLSEIEREIIEQALARAENDASPARLKSGINVALKARLFGKQLNLSAAVIRESYRNFIESDENERRIYQGWVLMFGGARRHMLINFMESALWADMISSDPGCSDIEFGNLLGRLRQIRVIRSSDALFIHRVSNDNFFSRFNFSEDDWLLFILPILHDAGLLCDQLRQLGNNILSRISQREKVCFIQKIYHFVRDFPPVIFDSDDQQKLLHQHFKSLIGHGYQAELAESRNY
ncbi:type III secretion system gatekeeper subunit SctW [Winslowiella iniecta]|uniref:type III secretion system gatekeeper subunit SctW n=1 Tax=Winslowiella iniecta TaxID=1560201 RepID=UPI00069D8EDC|nr:type III secretion system gatekeeper subunit SctW [Winslowiella iniecta]